MKVDLYSASIDDDCTALRHEALGEGLAFLLELHDRIDRLELACRVTDCPRFEDVGDFRRLARRDLRRRERRRVEPINRAWAVTPRADEFFGLKLLHGATSKGRRHVGVQSRVDLVGPHAKVVTVLAGLQRQAEHAPKV